jgi:hypothetical protein
MFPTGCWIDPARQMREGRSVTIHFGLDDGEPPTGVVVANDAVSVPFAGWLELMHAISRVASGVAPDGQIGTPARLDPNQKEES